MSTVTNVSNITDNQTLQTLHEMVSKSHRDILLTKKDKRPWKLKERGTHLVSGSCMSFIHTVDPDGTINHFLNNAEMIVMKLGPSSTITMECNGKAADYSWCWI